MGKKRGEIIEKTEISKEEREGMRENMEANEITKRMMERLERKEKEKRGKSINESKYNEHYKNIRTEEKPGYLRGRRKKKERNLIARYRCGNETRGSKHWSEEEERKCRVCKEKIEDWRHILTECVETKEEIEIEKLLGENGEGYEIMKRIDKIREERRKEEETETREREETQKG